MSPNSIPPDSPEAEQPQIYSVSEITRDIRAILEASFDSVWIEGEVSNLRVAQSQHAYFVLKDDKAQIRCVMFRNQRNRLQFKLEEGAKVLLFGRMTLYDPRGEYQIIVETLEPRGLGALQVAFEQLKAKLEKEGLFEASNKKPLPALPWKVGVVTSPTGAAIRDILNVLKRRNPKLSVIVFPVRVQGQGSAEEIARGIDILNQRDDLDILIVGRGGGSIEDLWAFNEEVVARSIFQSSIPVISAVGHEIDFTIADFVADLRAATPSAAAELATPVLSDIILRLRDDSSRLLESIHSLIASHRDELKSRIDRRFFRDPAMILENPTQRLDDWTLRLSRSLDSWLNVQNERLSGRLSRLKMASPTHSLPHIRSQLAAQSTRLIEQMTHRTHSHQLRLDGLMQSLNSLSPLNILERGYSIAERKQDSTLLKSASQVKEGDTVQIRLHQGKLNCTVDETFKEG